MSNECYECSSLSRVKLSDNLTTIGTAAFRDCGLLDSIYLPGRIKSIPSQLFYGCQSLSYIEFGGSIQSIGSYAFSNTALRQLVLPETVTEIGERAFSSADSLRFVHLPSRLKEIPEHCFSYCDNLELVELPAELNTIGYYAFWSCTSLKSVAFPESLVSIGENAFNGCVSLESFNISDGVTEIAPSILWSCSNLKKLRIGISLSALPFEYGRAYGNIIVDETSTLGSYSKRRTNPNITWYIDSYEEYLTSLKEVIIADAENELSMYGFGYVSSSSSSTVIQIPPFSNADVDYYYVGRPLDKVRSWVASSTGFKIGVSRGFGHIRKLEISGYCNEVLYFYQKVDSLILGSSVVKFSAGNICGADTLQYIECHSDVPPVLSGKFSTKTYTDVVVAVPVGCRQVYQDAPGWESFWNIVEGDFVPTGIERVDADGAGFTIRVEDGSISLPGAEGQPVWVYDLAGRLVDSAVSYNGQTISLPAGSYILRVGSMTRKVVL